MKNRKAREKYNKFIKDLHDIRVFRNEDPRPGENCFYVWVHEERVHAYVGL
jgi:hypothetical protein